MKNVLILTGSELRHEFFRKYVAASNSVNVVATYCEGAEKSLKNLVKNDEKPDTLRLKHLRAREQSEEDFFRLYCDSTEDKSNPVFIKKGEINNSKVVASIKELDVEVVVAYGCSIIKSDLLEFFDGKFINIHLGLSPYYRGSGTNYWPLVNKEPEFVGATFMHIDAGIDTGEIIHQIRAKVEFADNSVTIGNRLIIDVAKEITKLVNVFPDLITAGREQFNNKVQEKYYSKKDYNEQSVEQLYDNFNNGMIADYIDSQAERESNAPIALNKKII